MLLIYNFSLANTPNDGQMDKKNDRYEYAFELICYYLYTYLQMKIMIAEIENNNIIELETVIFVFIFFLQYIINIYTKTLFKVYV